MSNTSFWDLSWSGWVSALIGLIVALFVLRTTLKKDREAAAAQRAADRELAAEQRAADLALAREERAHDAALRLVIGVYEAMVAVKRVDASVPTSAVRDRLQAVVEDFDRVFLGGGPALRDHALEALVFEFRQSLSEYREWLSDERRRRDALASLSHPLPEPRNLKAAYAWLNERAVEATATSNAWRRGEGWNVTVGRRSLTESVALSESGE